MVPYIPTEPWLPSFCVWTEWENSEYLMPFIIYQSIALLPYHLWPSYQDNKKEHCLKAEVTKKMFTKCSIYHYFSVSNIVKNVMPLFQCDAKSFVLSLRVGLDPQCHNSVTRNANAKICITPNANPQREQVEYRSCWVPKTKFSRWPCTFLFFLCWFHLRWVPSVEYGL